MKTKNNYTSYANLQKIKCNLIDVYADYLKFNKDMQKKYPTYEERCNAFEKFVEVVRPIKNLATLQEMRKRYAK